MDTNKENNFLKIESKYILKGIFFFLNEKQKLKMITYNKNDNIELEIIDGKGKGKEYYDNGNIQFEGEYLNGERNGKGKEYDFGKLKFEGKYLNGKRNGKGK